jgi:hypothetical protein
MTTFYLPRLLLVPALLLFTGCVIFYPYANNLGARAPIDNRALGSLRIGSTTIEDVLFRLGEPEEHYEDPTIFLYHWTRLRGFHLFGVGPAPGAVGGGNVEETTVYTLRVTFDDHAMVTRYRVTRVP